MEVLNVFDVIKDDVCNLRVFITLTKMFCFSSL